MSSLSQPDTLLPMDDEGFEVRELHVAFGASEVVGGITINVARGTVTGVAGESGSGKTTAALTSIGYTPPGARLIGGSAFLDGVDLLGLDDRARRRMWASRISYVAQDTASTFNP